MTSNVWSHSTGWLRFPLSYHREQKLVKHANEHIQKSAQRLADEDALTSSCFFNLEDEIVESERRNARMHLHRWNEGVKKVLVLKGELSCESCAREREDSVLLDTVIESQQLLQHTVRGAASFLFMSRGDSRLFAAYQTVCYPHSVTATTSSITAITAICHFSLMLSSILYFLC